MPPPSPLIIAAQSVTRLVKEEANYHKELDTQKKQAEELRKTIPADASYDDSYMLKQQETAIKETEKVLGPLRTKIEDAVQKLEEQIALSESSGGALEEDLKKAREALSSARKGKEAEAK